MRWRKRLTGLLLLLLLAALGGAAWVAYQLLFPLDVTAQVVAGLEDRFVGVQVRVGSARLRLLGGIAVTDLALVRRDDPAGVPFLTVPRAVIYHDKERLAQGKLAVRKVELDRPRIRVERRPDGRLNVADVLGPADLAEPVPTFVVHNGTVAFTDRLAGGGRPPVELAVAHLSLLNDPPETLRIEARAGSALTGAVRADLRVQRTDSSVGGLLELPALPLGPALAHELAAYLPDAAEKLAGLEGSAALSLTFLRTAGPEPRFRHQLRAELRDGRFRNDDLLPLPLEGLSLKARLDDGRLVVERCAARAGQSQIELSLETLPAGAAAAGPAAPAALPFGGLEERLRRLELTVRQLELSGDLFAKLPPSLRKLQPMFSPAGSISLTYMLSRQGAEWQKRCLVHPEGLAGSYEKFCYPLAQVRGTLDQLLTSGGVDRLRIDLTAAANGRPVTIKGKIEGRGPAPEVDLNVTVTGLPLDEQVIAALPEKYRPMARSFHPAGKGDATAVIKQAAGVPEFHNRFTIRFRDATANYDVFPVPIEDITGTLIITTGAPAGGDRPAGDSWEFRDFVGTHDGGLVRVSGRNEPSPRGDVLTIDIEGEKVPLDLDLKRALAKLGLGPAWESLRPSGRADFVARLRRVEPRPAAPDGVRTAAAIEPEPLDVAVRLAGPSLDPEFFPYRLDGVRGVLHYADDEVDLTQFSARHGPSELSIPRTKVYLRPGGGLWAGLSELSLNPLVADDDFLAALPPKLRAGLKSLDLRGPARLDARRLVVDAPKAVAPPPTELVSVGGPPAVQPPLPVVVFWDGGVTLAGASLNTGVEWEDVHGQVGCRGESRGDQLGQLIGDLVFNRAQVLRQPLQQVHAHFETDPQAADVLKLPAIGAKLYGGDVGGECRLWLDAPARFDLKLTALQVDLKEAAKTNRLGPEVTLDGPATVQLYLTNRDAPGRRGPPVLQGEGSFDVPRGQIAKLPPLLDLLKVLNLRAPDRTAFEEVHAQFKVHGDRVRVTQLDLLGNAISLGGEGELGLDGSDVKFDFYAVWSRIGQMLPGPVRELPVAVSKNLFKIEATGSVGGKLDFKKEAVPCVVDPIKRLFERLNGRPQPGPAEPSPFGT